MKTLTALTLALLLTTPALAQQNPTADAVALQIGRLSLANAQAVAQINELQKQLAEITKARDEAIDKCGKPCEGMVKGPRPVKTETVPAPEPPKP